MFKHVMLCHMGNFDSTKLVIFGLNKNMGVCSQLIYNIIGSWTKTWHLSPPGLETTYPKHVVVVVVVVVPHVLTIPNWEAFQIIRKGWFQNLWVDLSRYIAPRLNEGNIWSLEIVWVEVWSKHQPWFNWRTTAPQNHYWHPYYNLLHDITATLKTWHIVS